MNKAYAICCFALLMVMLSHPQSQAQVNRGQWLYAVNGLPYCYQVAGKYTTLVDEDNCSDPKPQVGHWSQGKDGKTRCYPFQNSVGAQPISKENCPRLIGTWAQDTVGNMRCYPPNFSQGTAPIEDDYCRK